MKPEAQAQAIARVMDWEYYEETREMAATYDGDIIGYSWPSLDAMHEAEKVKEMHWDQRWVEAIVRIGLREAAMDYPRTDGWDWVLIVSRLSAAQRAEAFLRTLNLWTE